jgi:hypothetical protein
LPVEDELVALAAKVLPGLLLDPVEVDLEIVAQPCGKLDTRPFDHAS